MPLFKASVRIGRLVTNDLFIADANISREHALVAYDDGGFWLIDLNSTNGTFVNDERIEKLRLRHNDVINLGQTTGHRLVFKSQAEAAVVIENEEPMGLLATPDRLRHLSALLEISKTVNSSLRVEEVLTQVIDAVMLLIGAQRSLLMLGDDPDNLEVRVHRNFASDDEELKYSHSVVADVYSSGKPRILRDTAQDTRFSAQRSIFSQNLRTVMCVPLLAFRDDTDDTEVELIRVLKATHQLQLQDGSESGSITLAEHSIAIAGMHDFGQGRPFITDPLATRPPNQLDDRPVIGVIYADKQAPTQFFTHQDLALFESLASHAAIAIQNAQLHENLQESQILLAASCDATLEGWSRALELRDKETEGHTRRVADLTVRLAQMIGVDDDELVHVRRGALLHDIGKMGIPDAILLKPGPLDEREIEVMQQHPVHAYELLRPIKFLRPALDIPYCHHEKWDGSGYPQGLEEDDIPIAARIFALVDVWDALLSDRPYRKAWATAKILEYIEKQAGTHFDPELIEPFIKAIKNPRK